jgi:hypothetical protein
LARKRNWWEQPAGADAGPTPDLENSPMTSGANQQTDEADAIRWDLVERIRHEIAEGTYETPEKIALALERLLRQLDRE